MAMDAVGVRSLRPFSPPSILRSPLLHASLEHAVPPLEELLALEVEMRGLQSKALSRAKRAEVELNAFETVYRKAKEREKTAKNRIKIKEKDRDKDKERLEKEREKVASRQREAEVDAFREGREKERAERTVFPVVKIKREYSGTPDVEDAGISPFHRPLLNGNRKPQNASAAKAAAIKAAALPHPVAGPSSHLKHVKAKAKRKRPDDSDDDAESINSDLMPPPSQRPRPSPHPHPSQPSSASSAVAKIKTTIHVKPPSSIASTSSLHVNGSYPAPPPPYTSTSTPAHTGVATEFIPPPKALIPVKTIGAVSSGFTYTKTTTNPREVREDFTDRKAPSNQTPVNTFWKEVESWMKPVGEEDVAWLEFDADDVEPFLIPALGKHYTEVWEEEDRLAAIAAAAAAQSWPRGYSLDRSMLPLEDPPPSATSAISLHNPYPNPNGTVSGSQSQGKEGDAPMSGDNTFQAVGIRPDLAVWDPRTITEGDLAAEEKALGPVSERIMSAFLLELPATHKSREDEMSAIVASGVTGTGPKIPNSGSKSASAGNTITTVGDLEARIRAELKGLGLLGEEEPNFANPLDDDITSTLRRCQSVLRQQRSINLARKSRLLSIARDRLAHQDYQNTLDGLEKPIASAYAKIVKAFTPKKKKEKAGGGGDDPKPVLPVVLETSDQITEKIRLRDKWVEVFGTAMQEWEGREPGRLMGLPPTSIYDGLEGNDSEVAEPNLNGVGSHPADMGDNIHMNGVHF